MTFNGFLKPFNKYSHKSWIPLLASIFTILAATISFASESAVQTKLQAFTRTLVKELSAKVLENPALAIADFDNVGNGTAEQNLGSAVSEIITENFQKSGNFKVLEKKQLKQIIQTLALEQTGLYDSDKIPAIGKLINARYLMVGSVSKLAGFYRISIRVVDVESGLVILSDSVEIDSTLLENAAEKYQPPKYRIGAASSMSWFALTPNNLDTYSIGVMLGFYYNISGPHWLSFQALFYFWNFGIYNTYIADLTYITVNYSLRNTFVLLAQYGYSIPVSKVLSIEPRVGVGGVIGDFNRYETYSYSSNTYQVVAPKTPDFYFNPIVQLTVNFKFLEKNPVSFYIGTGFFMYLNPLYRTFHELTTNLPIAGIKLEGSILFYL